MALSYTGNDRMLHTKMSLGTTELLNKDIAGKF
jgi:hypothetical protein